LQDLNRTVAKVAPQKWVPTAGPQRDCYYSDADEVLFGGSAGGGKTMLLLGLAIQEHQRSLILRRLNIEVDDLVDACAKIVGHRTGYNGQKHRWNMPDGRLIQFGGCQHLGDERKFMGQPKDFLGADEAANFLESQIDFLKTWLRSADPKQRCRLVLASNPPTTVDGEWITRWFAPWLDPVHDLYPYPPGKLLYFERLKDGSFHWEEEPFPIALPGGGTTRAISRTFIPSALKDNPTYAMTGEYAARLASLPEALRRRYERGDFTAGAEDDENQVIPTAWILAAQDRWKEAGGKPPKGLAMSALAQDVAQGGADDTVIATRHDYHFNPLIVVPGVDTPNPSDSAALVVKHRRDMCAVVIDVGGGYGGGVVEFLGGNNIRAVRYNGANASHVRTSDKALSFANKRAESIWRFREALDPGQAGGSPIELPEDGPLRSDLAAYRWHLTARGIQIEDNDEIRKRLGRSPDRGSAVVMCWSEGQRAIAKGLIGPGARMDAAGERQTFAKVRPGPLTQRNRYGDQGPDDSGTPPWKR